MQSFQQSLEDQPLRQRTKENFYPQATLKPIQIKPKINYVKQYFESPGLLHIPAIDMNMFQRKIRVIEELCLEYHNGTQKFRVEYPLGMPLTLNKQFCSNFEKTQQLIKSLDASALSLNLTGNNSTVLSLYFGQQTHYKKSGYGIYVEFTLSKNSLNLLYFYQGLFDNNLRHGFALQLNLQRKSIYIGDFTNGEQFSLNTSLILNENGDVYVGGVLGCQRNGKGVFFKKKISMEQTNYQAAEQFYQYEAIVMGTWENNRLLPSQDYLNRTGLKDIFAMDLFRLEVNLLIVPTSVYCGDIKIQEKSNNNSVILSKQGKGFEYFSKGDIYRGEYDSDKPHGEGHYIWSNKDEYIGQFYKGTRQGKGQWTSSKGESYLGEFQNDKKSGFGVYRWNNGNIYEGEFSEDQRDGHGKMIIFQKEVIQGIWKGGVKQNQRNNTNFSSMFKKSMMEQRQKPKKQQKLSPLKAKDQSNTEQNLIKRKKSQSVDRIQNKKVGILRQKIQKYSLAELQSIPSSVLNKFKLKKRKERIQVHGFLDNARRESFLSEIKSKDITLQNPTKTDPTTNNQTISQHQGLLPLRTNIPIKKSIEKQLIQSFERQFSKEPIARGKKTTDHNIKKREEGAKLRTEGAPMGDTLMKPIKWRNFRSSWEPRYL